MKGLIALIFVFISIESLSQTSLKVQPPAGTNLDQYMWSYSKNKATSEKPLIDFNVMDNWRGISDYFAVNNDGSYIAYTINKIVFNESRIGLFAVDTLVIQSTKTGQRAIFAGIEPGSFTSDSKQYIFLDGETLCLLQLGSLQQKLVKGVASYRLSQNNWLAYQLKGKDDLTLKNLVTGKEKQFPAVTGFEFNNTGEWLICKNSNENEIRLYNLAKGSEKQFSDIAEFKFSENGKALLLKTKAQNGASLQYVDFSQSAAKTIFIPNEKTGISSYSLDPLGQQVVFTIVDSTNAMNNAVGYYERGMEKSVIKVTSQTTGFSNRPIIMHASFANDGRYIKLSLEPKPDAPGVPAGEIAGVELWNTKDVYLQSVQAKRKNEIAWFNAIANIESGKIVLLESSDRKLDLLEGDFALLKKSYNEQYGDRFWEKQEDSTWLVSLKDGSNYLLPTRSRQFWFSPDQKWLVYLDAEKGFHYYSYDLSNGSLKDITVNVPQNQFVLFDRREKSVIVDGNKNVAAWIENNPAILVYDAYDIWKLDLTGRQDAVNITNKFGRSTSTILRLFSIDRLSNMPPAIKVNESLLLQGYKTIDRQSGFYRKVAVDVGLPTELYMGKYFMYANSWFHAPNMSNPGMVPVKAKNANIWIVQRQSATDAPNYYKTNDFKSFKKLTNFQPQSGFQWLSEELVSFKYLDGKMGQGILYKPENFDPQKKYPVLIAFYENYSDCIYQFRMPSYNTQAIEPGKSPVWFLNNGYLVFIPDIEQFPVNAAPKAFSVIEGAVQYLKALPYVDANKFGCASHSASAKLGAYIFTHSKSIAATAISEGFLYGNAINEALGELRGGAGRLEEAEVDFKYENLWQNKDTWLDKTTVLNVDKVNSPILLFCNQESSKGMQDQTIQLFTGLRRLEKKVWWPKYDKGAHILGDLNELKDYTIRYTHFFDHYLKEAPAPLWMTRGIPYKLKGIENRYELDPQGTCNPPNGEPCAICEAWNKQFKRTPAMFKKEIKYWVLDKDIADELNRRQNEKRNELDREGVVRTKEVLQMLNAK
jgi:dipeptidyl aminopeptidase/acylaminoacyl peptidase